MTDSEKDALLKIYSQPAQVGMTRLIIRSALAQMTVPLMAAASIEIRLEALKKNLSQAQNVGPWRDPTGYRDLLYSGGFEAVEDEIAACEMMLKLLSLSKRIPSGIGPDEAE